MANTYSLILTDYGRTREQECLTEKVSLALKTIRIGDGNGEYVELSREMTSLVNETESFNIDAIEWIDSTLVAKTILPVTKAISNVREVGLFDEFGKLIAIQNCAPTFKNNGSDGEYHELTLQFDLSIFQEEMYPYIANANVSIATQDWVKSYLKAKDIGFLEATGIVDINDPEDKLLTGMFWIPSNSMDALEQEYPLAVKRKLSSGEYMDDEYTPHEGDMWRLPDENHYYWTLGKWEQLNFTCDLSPYRKAVDQDAIDAKKKLRFQNLSSQVNGTKKVFQVDKSQLNTPSILVLVNGLMEFNYTYVEATGVLTLAYAPEANTDLRIINI